MVGDPDVVPGLACLRRGQEARASLSICGLSGEQAASTSTRESNEGRAQTEPSRGTWKVRLLLGHPSTVMFSQGGTNKSLVLL